MRPLRLASDVLAARLANAVSPDTRLLGAVSPYLVFFVFFLLAPCRKYFGAAQEGKENRIKLRY